MASNLWFHLCKRCFKSVLHGAWMDTRPRQRAPEAPQLLPLQFLLRRIFLALLNLFLVPAAGHDQGEGEDQGPITRLDAHLYSRIVFPFCLSCQTIIEGHVCPRSGPDL